MNKKILAIVLIILLIIILISFVFLLTRTIKKDEGLIGSWSLSDYTYTFNKDKTGNYSYDSTVINFTYEDNGTELSILYDGNTVPGVFNYRIEDNKLIVTDSFGEDVEYIKK